MEEIKKIGFDLDLIFETFQLNPEGNDTHLRQWVEAKFTLTPLEKHIVDKAHREMLQAGDYLNEEELKIRFVASLFLAADVDVKNKIRVFYERALSATVNKHALAVKCDCMVATPRGKNSPREPIFFLQEFKKGKGEKNDPEAQMLVAMLIAQQKNADKKPLYGGFLVGTDGRFATLVGNEYAASRKFDATRKEDVEQMVYILKNLKDLILNR